MTYKMYAFIVSLGAAALLLVTNETFARPGAAAHGGFASAHAMSHPFFPGARHHRRGVVGGVWPAWGDYFFAPNGEPMGVAPPPSGDIHYTTTQDVPWDWAHRFPPMVAPSDRPYVPSCPTESVTVPGRDGTDRTINVIRCY